MVTDEQWDNLQRIKMTISMHPNKTEYNYLRNIQTEKHFCDLSTVIEH